MRLFKSVTGALFAALYAIAFVAVYLDYLRHAGQWFADTQLILAALPFVLTMRFLSGGSFGMGGGDSLKLLAGALFCCVIAYIVGYALESLLRAVCRLARVIYRLTRRNSTA